MRERMVRCYAFIEFINFYVVYYMIPNYPENKGGLFQIYTNICIRRMVDKIWNKIFLVEDPLL